MFALSLLSKWLAWPDWENVLRSIAVWWQWHWHWQADKPMLYHGITNGVHCVQWQLWSLWTLLLHNDIESFGHFVHHSLLIIRTYDCVQSVCSVKVMLPADMIAAKLEVWHREATHSLGRSDNWLHLNWFRAHWIQIGHVLTCSAVTLLALSPPSIVVFNIGLQSAKAGIEIYRNQSRLHLRLPDWKISHKVRILENTGEH